MDFTVDFFNLKNNRLIKWSHSSFYTKIIILTVWIAQTILKCIFKNKSLIINFRKLKSFLNNLQIKILFFFRLRQR